MPTPLPATVTARLKTTDRPAQITSVSSTAYTLVWADANSIVEATNASAVTVTVPPESSVDFPVGTIIGIFQGGAGTVTVAEGSGVTIQVADGATGDQALSGQYAELSLRKRSSDTWALIGQIA